MSRLPADAGIDGKAAAPEHTPGVTDDPYRSLFENSDGSRFSGEVSSAFYRDSTGAKKASVRGRIRALL